MVYRSQQCNCVAECLSRRHKVGYEVCSLQRQQRSSSSDRARTQQSRLLDSSRHIFRPNLRTGWPLFSLPRNIDCSYLWPSGTHSLQALRNHPQETTTVPSCWTSPNTPVRVLYEDLAKECRKQVFHPETNEHYRHPRGELTRYMLPKLGEKPVRLSPVSQ